MSSLVDSKTTTERKTVLAINIVAYSFLYIFTIALFFLSWVAYFENNILQLVTYATVYFAFLIAFFLVVRDIYSNYDYFILEGNSAGVELLEGAHFLCADPMCARCGGWYVGVTLSLAVGTFFANSFKDFLSNYAYSGIFLIVLGGIMFLLATPIHGSMNFLGKFHERALGSKRLKLLCGFISGISIFLIAVGILIIMP